MLNEQKPEKKAKDHLNLAGVVDVIGVWRTIQGEGPFSGSPAVFVRLAGCNLQCPLCDTDYTSFRRILSPGDVVRQVQILQDKGLVVLTGGEPFRQDISKLAKGLVVAGFQVQIETNGTLYQSGFPYDIVHIVCSPKSPEINKRLRPHISSLKYVVQAGHVDPGDGLPTMVLGMPCRVARPDGMLYSDIFVQPADEQDDIKNKKNLEAALDSCMKFGYRFSFQLHKFLGMP